MARPFEAYENLKEKLGEQQARAVIEYIDTTTKQGLATKDDINRLELSVKDDINRLELKIKDVELKVENVRTELRTELSGVKADLIKWMVGTGIGIVALLFSILRFTGKS